MTDADMKLFFVFSIISVVFAVLYQSDKHIKKIVASLDEVASSLDAVWIISNNMREELEELRRMLKDPDQ
ncbi:MAG: hypothetical protein ACK5X3_10665 [Pseudomonadota bacterium]|jgi:uncharacterized membrane protein